jgi:hypothetical protein
MRVLKEKLKNFYRPIYKYILLRQNNEFRIDHERKVTEIAHTENTAPSSDYHWAWQLVGIEKETKKNEESEEDDNQIWTWIFVSGQNGNLSHQAQNAHKYTFLQQHKSPQASL